MKRAWAVYLASALMFVATVGFGFDLFGLFSFGEKQWLVVLEHNWEHGLSEQEFSEGEMLKAYFKKDKGVQVRHRFFTDAASLKKWCEEIKDIRGPVVLMICDHGSTDGLYSDDGEIGYRVLAEALADTNNLKLIHISACSVLKADFAHKLMKHMGNKAPPVSGYSTDINWGLSGIVDMLYLDMVVSDKMSPWAAYVQVRRMMPIAGIVPVPGAAYRPLGFCIELPNWPHETREPLPHSTPIPDPSISDFFQGLIYAS